MPRHRFAPLIALLSAHLLNAGCAGAPAPSPAPEPTPRAQPGGRSPLHYVWYGARGGPLRTTTLRLGAWGATVVDDQPGLRIATADGVWAWRARDEPLRRSDCQCLQGHEARQTEPPPGDCEEVVNVPRVSLVGPGDEAIELAAPAADGSASVGSAELTTSFEPLGSHGPFLFVRSCTLFYVCGAAHPGTECRFDVYDLERRTRLGLDEAFADPGPLAPSAALQHVRARSSVPLDEVGPEDVTRTLAFPDLTEGALRWVEQYTAPACYACSDGRWSSYSVSALVERDAAPTRLQMLRAIPPSVSSFLRNLSERDVVGWSISVANDAPAR